MPQKSTEQQRRPSGIRWLRVHFLVFAILAGVFVVYLLLYVGGRRSEFRARAFRTLASVASDLDAKLTGLDGNLDYAAKALAAWRKARPEGDLDLEVRKRLELIPIATAQATSRVEARFGEHPPELGPGRLLVDLARGEDLLWFSRPVPDANSSESVGSSGLRPGVVSSSGNDSRNVFATAELTSLLGDEHDLLGPGFDALFVALADGSIPATVSRGSLGLTRLAQLQPCKAGEAIDLMVLGGTPQALEVKIAGECFELFLQPARLPLEIVVTRVEDPTPAPAAAEPGAAGPPRHAGNGARPQIAIRPIASQIVVGGIIRSGRLDTLAMQLPRGPLTALLGLVLVAAFSIPLLRVSLSGPQQRFRAQGVWGLFICSVLVVAVVTLLFIDTLAYQQRRAGSERKAWAIAERAASDLETEICQAQRGLLAFFGSLISEKGAGRVPGAWGKEREAGVYDYAKGTFELDALTIRAFLTDERGLQLLKWTTERRSTDKVDVGTRNYFKSAKARWRGQSGPGADGLAYTASPCPEVRWAEPFGLEFVHSMTTGESVAVLAAWLKRKDAPRAEGPFEKIPVEWREGLAALAFEPASLVDPVLPLDTVLAVVDGEGTVIFHSDHGTPRQENLVRELGGSQQLVNALGARRQDSFDALYHGSEHRVYVYPFPGHAPWSIVVLQDAGLIGALSFEALLVTVLLLAVPATLALLLFLACAVALEVRVPDRFWPDPARVPAAAQAILVTAIVAAWLCATLWTHAGAARLVVLAAVLGAGSLGVYRLLESGRALALWAPGVLLAAMVAALVLPTASDSAPWIVLLMGGLAVLAASPFVGRRAHGLPTHATALGRTWTAGVVAALLVLGVVPPLLVFADAQDYVTESLARLDQLEVALARAERGQGRAKRDNSLGDYAIASAPCEPDKDALSAWQRPFNAALLSLAPAYGESVGRIRRITWDGTGKSPWRTFTSRTGRGGCLVYGQRTAASETNLAQRASAKAPVALAGGEPLEPWTLSPGAGLGMAAVLALLGVSLWLGTRVVGRRLFGLDCDAGLPDGLAPRVPEASGSFLLLSPLAESRAWLEGRGKSIDKVTLDGDLSLDDARALRHLEERLAQGQLVILAEEDPQRRLTQLRLRAKPEDAAVYQALERRLAALPRRRVLPRSLVASARGPIPEEDRGWRKIPILVRECDGDPQLEALARQVAGTGIEGIGRRAFLERLSKAAHAYYERLWSECSDEEKLALHHLADGGFVNPTCWDAVRRLRRRGLVSKDPALRLVNESFRLYVLETSPSEEVERWEREVGEDSWRMWRGALWIVALAVAGFVLITQREAADTTAKIVASLAVVAPTLLRLLSTVRGERA